MAKKKLEYSPTLQEEPEHSLTLQEESEYSSALQEESKVTNKEPEPTLQEESEMTKRKLERVRLISKLNHPVYLSYGGETAVIPPRSKDKRVYKEKLGAVPKGIMLQKVS